MSYPRNSFAPVFVPIFALVFCMGGAVPLAAFAQTAANAPASAPASESLMMLDATARTEIINSVAATLKDQYVDEDAGKRIGEYIIAASKAGAYEKLTNPAQFAEAVTHDLRAINGDLHLHLGFAGTEQKGVTVLKKEKDGGSAGDEEKRAMAAATAEARRQNYGLGRAEILDGNIGYLEIRGFEQGDGYEEAVADALRFLQYTDAIIIDMRRNHGGSGEMSNLVYSHFFGAKPIATINFASRNSKEPEKMFTTEKVPGPRRPDVPLYVLNSQDTASAAEEFNFVLQNQHRATLIGSRTAGAGHMVRTVPVAHGFDLHVSITRVTDPVSGKEWEGTGVQPDIVVKPEQALAVAHAEAVRRVLAGTSDGALKQKLGKLLVTLDAQNKPQTEEAAALAAYTGIYQGREITLAANKLSFGRAGGMPEELTYLGNMRFALRSTQMRFDMSGGKPALLLEYADGSKVRLERDSDASVTH